MKSHRGDKKVTFNMIKGERVDDISMLEEIEERKVTQEATEGQKEVVVESTERLKEGL